MDGDRRALGRGLDRDLGTDAAAAAGDEHDPAGERDRPSRGADRGVVAAARRPAAPPAAARSSRAGRARSGGPRARGRSAAQQPLGVAERPPPISCSGSRTVDRPGATIAAVGMSSKPATETSPGTSIPSAASRWSAPRASRSLAAQTAVNGASAGQQFIDATAPPSRLKPVLTTRRSSYGEPGVGEAAAVALQPPARRRTATSGRRGTRSADGPARPARATIRGDAGGVVDADVRLAVGMRREVDDRRAVGPHRGHVLRHLASFRAASARPLPAKMTVAARMERSRRTYESSRSAIRSELQVMTRNPPTDAASSTPRTTSEKYGSVMSWTMTPTTGRRS